MLLNINRLEANDFSVDVNKNTGNIAISPKKTSNELFDKIHYLLDGFDVHPADSGQLSEMLITQVNNRKILRLCE